MTTDDTRRSDGQGLSDRDVDVLIEAAHPSRPDRRALVRGHVERILAARGGNTAHEWASAEVHRLNGIKANIWRLVDQWETFPCGGPEAVRQLRAALSPAPTNEARGGNTDNTLPRQVERGAECFHGVERGCESYRCGSNCSQRFDRMHPCPACLVAEIHDLRAALDAAPAPTETCRCQPCPGRGNDGHGLTHCAECCMGTGVEAEPDCPTHGYPPYNTPAASEGETNP